MTIDTTCKYCIDQGAQCTPLTVKHKDGTSRLIAMMHRRVTIVIEHYKDEPKTIDWRDVMMADAGGSVSLGSFGVKAEDLDSLRVWDE